MHPTLDSTATTMTGVDPRFPTPTDSGIDRRMADFGSLAEALDYAAEGRSGCNFYSARGDLVHGIPYVVLRERAIRQARKLAGLGLERGAPIALIAASTPDFVVGFMACQYGGFLAVPLPGPAAFADRAAYLDQLSGQIDRAGVRIAIVPETLAPWLIGPRFARARIMTPAALDRASAAAIDPKPLGPDELCYLQFSSGSTRFPTGIAVSQKSLMANCRGIAEHALKVFPEDRTVSWLPLYHDMGLVGTLLTSLVCQISIDLMASEDFARRPLQWLELLSRNRGTISYSPCFGYELCIRRATQAQIGSLDLSAWRVAGVGGEMIRPHVLGRFVDIFTPFGFRAGAVLASYGLAESTLGVTFARLGRGLETDTVDRTRLAAEKRAVCVQAPAGRAFARCGTPLPGHEIRIRGVGGEALPSRRVGRIFVRGASVMNGYFRDNAATATVLDPDGWLDTGDLGYMTADDGDLVIVARAKDSIIINGRNIWPQDIEWSVEQLPGVRSQDCAAFSILDQGEIETPVALLQCRNQDPAVRASLIGAARRAIRRSCGIECRVVLVPPRSLPRTSSGKLSRTRARENYLAGLYGRIDAERRSA